MSSKKELGTEQLILVRNLLNFIAFISKIIKIAWINILKKIMLARFLNH